MFLRICIFATQNQILIHYVWNSRLYRSKAVSYTHLDVYKRQAAQSIQSRVYQRCILPSRPRQQWPGRKGSYSSQKPSRDVYKRQIHERITDFSQVEQTLNSHDRKQVLAANGEIYNHRDIRARYAGKYAFQTGSDLSLIHISIWYALRLRTDYGDC